MDGIRLRTSVWGGGPPLPLVTGLGASLHLARPFEQELTARGVQTVAFDAPGIGGSTACTPPRRCARLPARPAGPGDTAPLLPAGRLPAHRRACPRRAGPPRPRRAAARIARPFVERPSVSGYFGQLYAVAGWTSLPWLHRLRQPTLVLAGDDDPIVPLRNGRR